MNHSKQSSNLQRSCLKSRINPSNEIHRSSTPYRVTFAHVNSINEKDLSEKKHRSDMFMKKAKEFQLAEIISFKDHEEKNDERR